MSLSSAVRTFSSPPEPHARRILENELDHVGRHVVLKYALQLGAFLLLSNLQIGHCQACRTDPAEPRRSKRNPPAEREQSVYPADQQRKPAHDDDGKVQGRTRGKRGYATKQTPQQNPERLVDIAQHRHRSVAVRAGAQQLAYDVCVDRDTIHGFLLAELLVVGRVETVFHALGGDADQHDLVADQRRIKSAGEKLLERDRRKGVGRITVVEQKLISAGIGAHIAAVVRLERADRRLTEPDVRRIGRIRRYGYALGLEVERRCAQRERLKYCLPVIQE